MSHSHCLILTLIFLQIILYKLPMARHWRKCFSSVLVIHDMYTLNAKISLLLFFEWSNWTLCPICKAVTVWDKCERECVRNKMFVSGVFHAAKCSKLKAGLPEWSLSACALREAHLLSLYQDRGTPRPWVHLLTPLALRVCLPTLSTRVII